LVAEGGHHIGYTVAVTSQTPYPNRLAEHMKAAKMTDPRLADLAGTSKQQVFKLRRGERKLTVQWAQRLAPHLNVAWLDLIEGQQLPPDQPKADLLAAWETMDGEQRNALLVVAKAMIPRERVEEAATARRTAPCLVPATRMRGQ
jgi:transcriptional regulator with XRE-family HTH domain